MRDRTERDRDYYMKHLKLMGVELLRFGKKG